MPRRAPVVDDHLETSSPGIFAAGDVAHWPGGADGLAIRVEHWVVAKRQGQVAAENILSLNKPFRDLFFLTEECNLSVLALLLRAWSRPSPPIPPPLYPEWPGPIFLPAICFRISAVLIDRW